MTFDWIGYRELAYSLIYDSTVAGESRCRTAVSRAYYYAFHTVQTFMIKRHGYSLQASGAHHQELVNKTMAVDKRLGNDLGKLLQRRRDADYNAEFSVGNWKEFAEMSLDKAIKIGTRVETL